MPYYKPLANAKVMPNIRLKPTQFHYASSVGFS